MSFNKPTFFNSLVIFSMFVVLQNSTPTTISTYHYRLHFVLIFRHHNCDHAERHTATEIL